MHINQNIVKRIARAHAWLLCAALVGCADEGAEPTERGLDNLGSVEDPPSSSAAGATVPGTDSTASIEAVGDAPVADGEEASSAGEALEGESVVGDAVEQAANVAAPPGEISSCLKGITNFFAEGPFRVQRRTSGSIKMWIPQVPAGCKLPMIHISNGTGATCSFYNAAIQRYASHGFLTLCYENANTGAGEYGIQAFEKALELYPDLADKKFGSSGHSQGGQAAFVTGQFAETKWPEGTHAILAMQPASGFGRQPRERWQTVYGKIKQPAAMYSGNSTDGLVSRRWVQDAFNALSDSTEAYHWSKSGASHFSPSGDSMEMGVAWFRWKLLGDQEACRAFKTVPTRFRGWTVAGQQAVQECQ